jgi:hypothetical protein
MLYEQFKHERGAFEKASPATNVKNPKVAANPSAQWMGGM